MTMQVLDHAPATRPDAPLYLSGQQTATAVGLSWERFRKVRADWTRDRDFPAEINEPGEAVRYLAAAVARWVERRSRRVHAGADPVAPPALAADPETRRAGRQGRAQLRLLKGGSPC